MALYTRVAYRSRGYRLGPSPNESLFPSFTVDSHWPVPGTSLLGPHTHSGRTMEYFDWSELGAGKSLNTRLYATRRRSAQTELRRKHGGPRPRCKQCSVDKRPFAIRDNCYVEVVGRDEFKQCMSSGSYWARSICLESTVRSHTIRTWL